MVDPFNVTDYNRSQKELEEFLLFSVVVAGKTASVITKKIDEFLNLCKEAVGKELTPFELIYEVRKMNKLSSLIEKTKLGNYTKNNKSFSELIVASRDWLNISTCSVEDLESIHGIGPKTARFFVLHSRDVKDIAALDTHILHWLRDQGYNAPKTTPSGKKYKELELSFLQEADKMGMNPADLDLKIWRKYTRSKMEEFIK